MKKDYLYQIIDLNIANQLIKKEDLLNTIDHCRYNQLLMNYTSLYSLCDHPCKVKYAGIIDMAYGDFSCDAKIRMIKDYINVKANKVYICLNHYHFLNNDSDAILEEISRLKAYANKIKIIPLLYVDLFSKNDLARILRVLNRLNINTIALNSTNSTLDIQDVALIKMIVGPKLKLEAMIDLADFKMLYQYVKAGISHFICQRPDQVIIDFEENYER